MNHKDKLKAARLKMSKIKAEESANFKISMLSDENIERIYSGLAEMHTKVEQILGENQLKATVDNTTKFKELQDKIELVQKQIAQGILSPI